jgi:hypothetical protein
MTGEQQEELTAVQPNFVMVFTDADGQEWHAAGYMSDLSRYDDSGNEVARVNPRDSKERQFAIRHLSIIETQ